MAAIKQTLLDALRAGPLLCDGAMGTQLIDRGLRLGEPSGAWNIDRPTDVLSIHRAYVAAGCDVATTNTFNVPAGRVREICVAGVRLARQANARFVLGNIGPGADVAEQAAALEGADGVLLETMSDPRQLALAIRYVRSSAPGLPIIASCTCRREGGTFRTLTGATIADVVDACADADVVGTNCGLDLSLDDYRQLAGQWVDLSRGKPVIVQPNAGTPRQVDDKYVYLAASDAMSEVWTELLRLGVQVIGGCCGTTPRHLADARKVLYAFNARQSC